MTTTSETTTTKKPQFAGLNFLNLSAFKAWLKNHTWKIIEFQDLGQDMQRMYIHKSGEILHCDFHSQLYNGKFVNLDTLNIGEKLQTYSDKRGNYTTWTRLIIENIKQK